jgi:predicted acylesterase/phospholipase RssA
MADAVILSGAVAKGAFTAGALAELFAPETQARCGLDVRRVVAASAGALNGAFLASRLRDGSEAAAMPVLEELWLELGDFRDVFDVSLGALARARGISTSKKVRALLDRFIEPRGGTRPIELALVVTNMDGEVDIVGSELATTYERCVRFSGEAFDDAEALSDLFDTVVASAAFPLVFEPATLRLGAREVRCVDGGVCNNTPIKYALDGAPDIDRVFVITPYPSVQMNAPNLHGAALLSHLGEMLVQERLFRDLRNAHKVNRALRALEHAMPLRALRERVLTAFGWAGRRVIQIVEVRPPVALDGDAFAGFFSRRLREDYVHAGREAARAALWPVVSTADAP